MEVTNTFNSWFTKSTVPGIANGVVADDSARRKTSATADQHVCSRKSFKVSSPFQMEKSG